MLLAFIFAPPLGGGRAARSHSLGYWSRHYIDPLIKLGESVPLRRDFSSYSNIQFEALWWLQIVAVVHTRGWLVDGWAHLIHSITGQGTARILGMN